MKGILQPEKNVLSEEEKNLIKNAIDTFEGSKTFLNLRDKSAISYDVSFGADKKILLGVFHKEIRLWEVENNSNNFSMYLLRTSYEKLYRIPIK